MHICNSASVWMKNAHPGWIMMIQSLWKKKTNLILIICCQNICLASHQNSILEFYKVLGSSSDFFPRFCYIWGSRMQKHSAFIPCRPDGSCLRLNWLGWLWCCIYLLDSISQSAWSFNVHSRFTPTPTCGEGWNCKWMHECPLALHIHITTSSQSVEFKVFFTQYELMDLLQCFHWGAHAATGGPESCGSTILSFHHRFGIGSMLTMLEFSTRPVNLKLS